MARRIEGVVERRIGALWPEVHVRVEARPLLDLELGDLGFDCCLAIGSILKLRPEEIAAKIVEPFGSDAEFEWTAVDGFINVRVRSVGGLVWSGEGMVSRDPLPGRVVVAPRTRGVSRSAFARLAGAAVVQTALARSLGGATELWIGAERCAGASIEDLAREVGAWMEEVSSAAAVEGLERGIAEAAPTDGVTVWMAPNFLERGAFRQFYVRFVESGAERSLRCPARTWLEGFQEEWGMMPAGALSRERIGAHLLHLAGPRLPDELDPHTVNLHEQGNLPWFIRATAERLDRLAPKLGAAAPAGAAGEVGVLDRLVVMRCLTLGFFERSAASRGDVGAWCGVLVDLLTAINRIANTPARRQAIEAGGLPPTEAKILSGARKAVSDIIRANPLF